MLSRPGKAPPDGAGPPSDPGGESDWRSECCPPLLVRAYTVVTPTRERLHRVARLPPLRYSPNGGRGPRRIPGPLPGRADRRCVRGTSLESAS
jgi:hypothetical protein